MLSPPFSDEIKNLYIKLREHGCTRRLACRICDVSERTIRRHEKSDPALAKTEEAARKGRAAITAFICSKAIEALHDPHGKNAIHWARWLLKVYGSPLPLPGDDDGPSIDGDGRTVINLVQVVKALDERRMIDAKVVKALPHEQETTGHLVDLDRPAEPVRGRRGNGRAASA